MNDDNDYKCKFCNTINQAHLINANKLTSQIESIILSKSHQMKDLAHNEKDLLDIEDLINAAQINFEQFNTVNKQEIYSKTNNFYLIKLYESYLELCISVKSYSKASYVAENLLTIYE